MVQGRGIDAHLNETGRKQAEQFYQAYKSESFDKVYVSTLIRTQESVSGFIKDGLPFQALPGLDEISWGSQEGAAFTPEAAKLYYDTVQAWKDGKLDLAVGGGESPNQVAERQKEAIEFIMNQTNEQKVLICMHGRAMRVLMSWLTAQPLSSMDQFEHTNLGLYEVEHINTFRVLRANEQSHLA
ncbi:MAG: histidine phosphatase family protein [Cyclobacteriaceae bacterium]